MAISNDVTPRARSLMEDQPISRAFLNGNKYQHECALTAPWMTFLRAPRMPYANRSDINLQHA